MDIVLNGEIIHVSITFGISDSDNENDLNKLIEIADDHLYIGKKEGRDRMILEDEEKILFVMVKFEITYFHEINVMLFYKYVNL